MKTDDCNAWLRRQLAEVETALEQLVPADAPVGLGLAMRYAVLDGGKRAAASAGAGRLRGRGRRPGGSPACGPWQWN